MQWSMFSLSVSGDFLIIFIIHLIFVASHPWMEFVLCACVSAYDDVDECII